MTPPDAPLILEPVLDTKIWGGRRLEIVLGKHLPTRDRYGESLESAGGSLVAGGPWDGWTLDQLLSRHGESILGALGTIASAPLGDFPLLAKFIDATETLSVQVHPNDDEAAPAGKRGKTEAWHVIAADDGASLITGLVPGTRVDDVRQAIEEVRLGELLVAQKVRPGDTLLIPAGTTHAIGAGILLYEIQQASDITYRMYDWGRTDESGRPRDLHVSESLAVLKPELCARPVRPLTRAPGRSVLAACRYFALERWDVSAIEQPVQLSGRSFYLASAINGPAELRTLGGVAGLSSGQTALVPACAGQIEPRGRSSLLVSYIPDLESDIVLPLLEMGHSAEDIAALSGSLDDIEQAVGR